jgi:hypothetical protein
LTLFSLCHTSLIDSLGRYELYYLVLPCIKKEAYMQRVLRESLRTFVDVYFFSFTHNYQVLDPLALPFPKKGGRLY